MQDKSKVVPTQMSEAQVKAYILPGNLGNNRTSSGPGYSKPMAPRRTVQGNSTGLPNDGFYLFDWLQSALNFSAAVPSSYTNGIREVGGVVKLGAPLTENTVITEDGYDFLADREETPGIGSYGTTTTYYKTGIEDVFGDGFNSNVRKFGTESEVVAGVYDETAELGVADDVYYGASVFYKTNDNINGVETFSYARRGEVVMQALTGGIVDLLLKINNSFISAQGGASSMVVNKNGQIVLQVGSSQIVLTGGIIEGRVYSTGISYNIQNNDHTVVATGAITLTLPTAPTVGQVFEIYQNNNSVTLSAGVGQTINGAASVALAGHGGVKVKYVSAGNYQTIGI